MAQQHSYTPLSFSPNGNASDTDNNDLTAVKNNSDNSGFSFLFLTAVTVLAVACTISFFGCSAIENKIYGLFDGTDVSAIIGVVETAWEEDGKQMIDGLTADFILTIAGENDPLKWPLTKIPKPESGSLTSVRAIYQGAVIDISGITSEAFDKYTEIVHDSGFETVYENVYQSAESMVSLVYDNEGMTLTVVFSAMPTCEASSEAASSTDT